MAGLVLLPELRDVGVDRLAQLLAVCVLGLMATLPWGAIVGSLVKSSQAGFGLSFLPISALIAISGIFYPISGLPGWLHPVAQVFPVYWLGLGHPGGAAAGRRRGRPRSAGPGGTWRRSACWACGRSSGWPSRRGCCAGWRSASPGRSLEARRQAAMQFTGNGD